MPNPHTPSATLDRAYRVCERLARDHAENFPVASFLLPAAVRRHLAAFYAFARVADVASRPLTHTGEAADDAATL